MLCNPAQKLGRNYPVLRPREQILQDSLFRPDSVLDFFETDVSQSVNPMSSSFLGIDFSFSRAEGSCKVKSTKILPTIHSLTMRMQCHCSNSKCK